MYIDTLMQTVLPIHSVVYIRAMAIRKAWFTMYIYIYIYMYVYVHRCIDRYIYTDSPTYTPSRVYTCNAYEKGAVKIWVNPIHTCMYI